MVNYIKVRPHVAQRLGVEAARYRYADGNYLIWDKELRMVDVGWVFHPEETVARIGGLMMDPYRNKEEQAKSAGECTPLPEPTDPAWAAPAEYGAAAGTEETATADETGELPADEPATEDEAEASAQSQINPEDIEDEEGGGA